MDIEVLNTLQRVSNPLIIQFDSEMRYIWFNQQLEDMLKLDAKEIVGKKPTDFLPPNVLKDFLKEFQIVLDTGEQRLAQTIIPDPFDPFTTTVYQEWTFTLTPHFRDGVIYRITFISSNTTAIWKMNEERNRILLEREFFFRIASHDLKTPLTSLKTCIEMIQRDPNTAPRLAAIMNNSVNKMEALIKDYLDWGRIISGKLELERAYHNTHELINDVFSMVSPQAQMRGIALNAEIHADKFYGDRTRVTQVLFNLISNAFKYGIIESGRKEIQVKIEDRDKETIFCVIDFGRGLNHKVQSGVFDSYTQCDKSNKEGGVGLGLSICKALIDLHGGQLTVDSEPDKGCHFCFSIPHQ